MIYNNLPHEIVYKIARSIYWYRGKTGKYPRVVQLYGSEWDEMIKAVPGGDHVSPDIKVLDVPVMKG